MHADYVSMYYFREQIENKQNLIQEEAYIDTVITFGS